MTDDTVSATKGLISDLRCITADDINTGNKTAMKAIMKAMTLFQRLVGSNGNLAAFCSFNPYRENMFESYAAQYFNHSVAGLGFLFDGPCHYRLVDIEKDPLCIVNIYKTSKQVGANAECLSKYLDWLLHRSPWIESGAVELGWDDVETVMKSGVLFRNVKDKPPAYVHNFCVALRGDVANMGLVRSFNWMLKHLGVTENEAFVLACFIKVVEDGVLRRMTNNHDTCLETAVMWLEKDYFANFVNAKLHYVPERKGTDGVLTWHRNYCISAGVNNIWGARGSYAQDVPNFRPRFPSAVEVFSSTNAVDYDQLTPTKKLEFRKALLSFLSNLLKGI